MGEDFGLDFCEVQKSASVCPDLSILALGAEAGGRQQGAEDGQNGIRLGNPVTAWRAACSQPVSHSWE